MYCYKCGTENPEIANFCRNCGTEVKQIEKFFTGELYCYKCGEKNLNEAKFCRACGFNIDSLRKVKEMPENLIYVKGGYFEMGDNFGDGDDDEKPVHKVYVDNFYISKYEVTQKDYNEIMGVNPSEFKHENKQVEMVFPFDKIMDSIFKDENNPVEEVVNNPVEKVSWYDALKYCNAKSRKEGLPEYYNISDDSVTIKGGNGYRLPTEAEWEYAARGGQLSKGYKYSGSNNIDEVAWYIINSGKRTDLVGTKKPNELGLYDMSGNIYEWCWDWYAKHYYSTSPQSNPMGPESGASRVIRGGSWNAKAKSCRLAFRQGLLPNKKVDVGFRVLRTD